MYFGREPKYVHNFPRDFFTGDGVTTQFTLSRNVPHSTATLVYVGGVVQFSSYSILENVITFSAAPSNGVPVVVIHLGFRGVIATDYNSPAVISTTSGTSAEYSSIPAGVSRIVVSLAGITPVSTGIVILQLGTTGGVETTGYSGATTFMSPNTPQYGGSAHTSGFIVDYTERGPLHGKVELVKQGTTDLWVASGCLAKSTIGSTITLAGSKLLTGAISRVKLTTEGGTDTFSVGSFNILYE